MWFYTEAIIMSDRTAQDEALQNDIDVLKTTLNELQERHRQQCLKTEAAHQKRREAEEELGELQGKMAWLRTTHEALNNEHKSLLELCYKLIKACKVAFIAIDEMKTSGDEQDWKAFNTFHRPHQVLLTALELVNRRWP